MRGNFLLAQQNFFSWCMTRKSWLFYRSNSKKRKESGQVQHVSMWRLRRYVFLDTSLGILNKESPSSPGKPQATFPPLPFPPRKAQDTLLRTYPAKTPYYGSIHTKLPNIKSYITHHALVDSVSAQVCTTWYSDSCGDLGYHDFNDVWVLPLASSPKSAYFLITNFLPSSGLFFMSFFTNTFLANIPEVSSNLQSWAK